MRGVLNLLLVVGALAVVWAVFWRGNPGGISDARYAEFQGTPAPKILYSCTKKPTRTAFLREERECLKTGRANCDAKIDELIKEGTRTEVDFVTGSGTSTLEELRLEAERACKSTIGETEPGAFKVLEAD